MNSKQILDVHQMYHLQELGLEMKETMLYWARCVDNNPRAATHYGKWVLIKGNNAQTVGLMHWEFIPAYTLQDVLDALPKDISKDGCTWYASLYIDFENNRIAYGNTDRYGFEIYHEIMIEKDLIDAAYSMLCWAIENKFIETNKNE